MKGRGEVPPFFLIMRINAGTIGFDAELDLSKLNAQMNQGIQLFKNLGQASQQTTQNLNQGIKNANQNLKQHTASLKEVFLQWAMLEHAVLNAYMAFKTATTVLVGLNKELAQTTMGFESMVAMVNTVARYTPGALQGVRQTILDLAKDIPRVPEELAKGLYSIVSATGKTGQELEVLKQANKDAISGFTDLETSSKALAVALNVYGDQALDVTQASNIMFKSVEYAIAPYGELAGQIGRVANSAKQSGQSFSTAAGALAFLNKEGIQSSRAATYLISLFNQIGNPKVQKNLKEILNIDVADAAGNFREFGDVMGELAQKLSKFNELGRNNLLKTIFTEQTRSGMALSTIINNFKTFKMVLDGTANSADASAQAFQRATDFPGYKIQLFINQWKTLKTEVGEGVVMALESLITILTNLNNIFVRADQNTKTFVGQATVITTTVVGLTTGIFALLQAIVKTSATMQIMNAIAKEMSPAMTGAGALLPKLVQGMGWWAVAIGAVIAALGILFAWLEKTRREKEQLVETTQKSAEAARDEAVKVTNLVKEFEELSKKTNKTVEEKNRLYNITSDLKQLVPDLNVHLTTEHGLMTDLASATDAAALATENYVAQQRKLLQTKSSQWQQNQAALSTSWLDIQHARYGMQKEIPAHLWGLVPARTPQFARTRDLQEMLRTGNKAVQKAAQEGQISGVMARSVNTLVTDAINALQERASGLLRSGGKETPGLSWFKYDPIVSKAQEAIHQANQAAYEATQKANKLLDQSDQDIIAEIERRRKELADQNNKKPPPDGHQPFKPPPTGKETTALQALQDRFANLGYMRDVQQIGIGEYLRRATGEFLPLFHDVAINKDKGENRLQAIVSVYQAIKSAQTDLLKTEEESTKIRIEGIGRIKDPLQGLIQAEALSNDLKKQHLSLTQKLNDLSKGKQTEQVKLEIQLNQEKLKALEDYQDQALKIQEKYEEDVNKRKSDIYKSSYNLLKGYYDSAVEQTKGFLDRNRQLFEQGQEFAAGVHQMGAALFAWGPLSKLTVTARGGRNLPLATAGDWQRYLDKQEEVRQKLVQLMEKAQEDTKKFGTGANKWKQERETYEREMGLKRAEAIGKIVQEYTEKQNQDEAKAMEDRAKAIGEAIRKLTEEQKKAEEKRWEEVGEAIGKGREKYFNRLEKDFERRVRRIDLLLQEHPGPLTGLLGLIRQQHREKGITAGGFLKPGEATALQGWDQALQEAQKELERFGLTEEQKGFWLNQIQELEDKRQGILQGAEDRMYADQRKRLEDYQDWARGMWENFFRDVFQGRPGGAMVGLANQITEAVIRSSPAYQKIMERLIMSTQQVLSPEENMKLAMIDGGQIAGSQVEQGLVRGAQQAAAILQTVGGGASVNQAGFNSAVGPIGGTGSGTTTVPTTAGKGKKSTPPKMSNLQYLAAATTIYTGAQNMSTTGAVLSGAATGFMVGGPVGAAVGGLLGLFGSKKKSTSKPKWDELLKQYFRPEQIPFSNPAFLPFGALAGGMSPALAFHGGFAPGDGSVVNGGGGGSAFFNAQRSVVVNNVTYYDFSGSREQLSPTDWRRATRTIQQERSREALRPNSGEFALSAGR